jgi:hypothetical protein
VVKIKDFLWHNSQKYFGDVMHKWEIVGYVASIFNPIPTGLIAGYYLYKDRKFRKTGRNVLLISILLPLILTFLIIQTTPTGKIVLILPK